MEEDIRQMILSAVELGYKSAEKGDTLEAALIEAQRLLEG
jgi:hypothetical protein